MLHAQETLGRGRSLDELLVRDELIVAPHSSINVPIGSSRRFAAVNIPLAELKTTSRGLGGSVNDVMLAACTSGCVSCCSNAARSGWYGGCGRWCR